MSLFPPSDIADMEKYKFKIDHIPIELNTFLYKLEKQRPMEWNLLLNFFEKNTKILHLIQVHEEDGYTFEKWLAKIKSWTYGQLMEASLTHLTPGNDISPILCDLADNYSPIKIADNTDKVVIVNLGEEVTLNVQATGVPSLEYHWFFWPKNECRNDWIPIDEIKDPEICIENIRLEDAGTYKCFVAHSLQVVDGNGSIIPGLYSSAFEVTIDPK